MSPASAATHRQPGQHGTIRGRLPSPPDRRQGYLADVLAWHRFGRFQLLVTAAVICCGDWPARRARAASRAAGVSAARMVASVRAYPAGWTGGSSTPIWARSASRAPSSSAAARSRLAPPPSRPGPPGTTAGRPCCRCREQRRRLGQHGLCMGVVALGQIDVAEQHQRHGRAPAIVVPARHHQAFLEHGPGGGQVAQVQQGGPQPAEAPGRDLVRRPLAQSTPGCR